MLFLAGCGPGSTFSSEEELQAQLDRIEVQCGGLDGYHLKALSPTAAKITVVGPVLLPPLDEAKEKCVRDAITKFGIELV
ncbi:MULTISPECIES: hypothetical protein [unclassified Sphingopyxis]|uniref:hypothetical protein n=1 Tax=unclassified Sphingopyxis TaxID=2614943 RepID=UPI0012E3E2E4|nr:MULTISPECIES: hypothetical protein [unclassified Sphingopyxis]